MSRRQCPPRNILSATALQSRPPPQLLNETHVAAVIATGKQYSVSTVYLDTLARTIGGDENGPDMGRYVAAVNQVMRA